MMMSTEDLSRSRSAGPPDGRYYCRPGGGIFRWTSAGRSRSCDGYVPEYRCGARLPIAASCLATAVPVDGATTMPAAELAAALGIRPGDEVGVLDVAGVPAARVRRREPIGEVTVDATDIPWPVELPVTRLDVYVPVPNTSEMLLLSFSTPMDPIADAMVVLFDAIAGSLQWRTAS